MNTQEMMRILDSIARDRRIEKSVLIKDLEQAMVSAARKFYNTLDAEEFSCTFDTVNGKIDLRRHGEPLEITPQDLGRIAAQTFKQVMIQRFRDDERQSVLDEFSKRVGEIATGTVQRYEGGALIVTIDRAEAFMPRSEQIPGEQFQAGDRVRCLLLDVRDVGNQVKIVLSRSHPDFIKRLFEAGAITRVLFLVDRIPLAKQTEDAFAEHLSDFPAYVLRAGRRFQDEKRITITTLQSMVNISSLPTSSSESRVS